MIHSLPLPYKVISFCILFFFLLTGFASGKKKLEPWDDKVFVEIERLHGAPAAKRIRSLHDFVQEKQHLPVPEKLELVNDRLNALPWIADSELWKQEDYWATPFETLATFGGDCEDIAIAKYVVLRLMGIPDKQLGFAYVVTADQERHMVLIFIEAPGKPPLVLDNQHPDVVPANKRRDLLAVYVFQNDGTFYLIDDDRKEDRKIKSQTQLEQWRISKWASGKERAKKDREYYRKFNNGRPLFPEWIKNN